MSPAVDSSAVRTFRINSPLQQMGMAIAACVIALVIVFLTLPPGDTWIILLLAAVLLFSLGLAYGLLTRTRLTVSSDGITFYGIGYHVASTWNNLKGYGTRTLGAKSVESLILTQPGIEVSGWMKAAYALMPVAEIASAAQGRVFIPQGLSRYQDVIPVSMFDKDWRSGELGALIQQYAPQAFDNHIV